MEDFGREYRLFLYHHSWMTLNFDPECNTKAKLEDVIIATDKIDDMYNGAPDHIKKSLDEFKNHIKETLDIFAEIELTGEEKELYNELRKKYFI